MSEEQSQATEFTRNKARVNPEVRLKGSVVDKATPVGELKINYNRNLLREEYMAFRHELQKAFKGHIQLDISFDDDCAKFLIDSMPVGLVMYSLSKVEGITAIKLKKLRAVGGSALLVCTYHVVEKV